MAAAGVFLRGARASPARFPPGCVRSLARFPLGLVCLSASTAPLSSGVRASLSSVRGRFPPGYVPPRAFPHVFPWGACAPSRVFLRGACARSRVFPWGACACQRPSQRFPQRKTWHANRKERDCPGGKWLRHIAERHSTTVRICSSGVEAPAVTPTVSHPANHAESSSWADST